MKEKSSRRSPVAVVCSILGTLLLVVLILGCLPFALSRAFGYQAYNVISGSMEPEIPVGSLVCIAKVEPEDVQKKDVIAFYGGQSSNAIIVHRVLENRVVMGEFITKGDANEKEDLNPVKYKEFIGRVDFSIPYMGEVAQFISSQDGKIASFSMIGLALVMYLLASALDSSKKKKNKRA